MKVRPVWGMLGAAVAAAVLVAGCKGDGDGAADTETLTGEVIAGDLGLQPSESLAQGPAALSTSVAHAEGRTVIATPVEDRGSFSTLFLAVADGARTMTVLDRQPGASTYVAGGGQAVWARFARAPSQPRVRRVDSHGALDVDAAEGVGPVAVDPANPNRVFVASSLGNQVVLMDAATGAETARAEAPGPRALAPDPDGGVWVAAHSSVRYLDGNLNADAARQAELANVSDLTLTGDSLWALRVPTTGAAQLAVLDRTTGQTRGEFPVPKDAKAPGILKMTASPSTAWVANGPTVWRFDKTGATSTFEITTVPFILLGLVAEDDGGASAWGWSRRSLVRVALP